MSARPTKGPWEAVTRPSDGQIFGRDEAYYVIPTSLSDDQRDPRYVAEYAIARALTVLEAFDGVAEAKANCALFAEAGTVYHETQLTPRELADQRAELLASLQRVLPYTEAERLAEAGAVRLGAHYDPINKAVIAAAAAIAKAVAA